MLKQNRIFLINWCILCVLYCVFIYWTILVLILILITSVSVLHIMKVWVLILLVHIFFWSLQLQLIHLLVQFLAFVVVYPNLGQFIKVAVRFSRTFVVPKVCFCVSFTLMQHSPFNQTCNQNQKNTKMFPSSG